MSGNQVPIDFVSEQCVNMLVADSLAWTIEDCVAQATHARHQFDSENPAQAEDRLTLSLGICVKRIGLDLRPVLCERIQNMNAFPNATGDEAGKQGNVGACNVMVQDQIDTDSPMGRAMFTIIGAMAELESSLISERVTAGMRAAETRGKHLGRPATAMRVIGEIEVLAKSTDLSIRAIQRKIAGRASRGIIGKITKRARTAQQPAL
jgi:hypothetical protein